MRKQFVKPSYRVKPDTSYIGVGLRHPHFQDALSGSPSIDFVEVHAENFFAGGGLAPAFLEDIVKRYDLSLHSTSMGLGSATGVNNHYLEKLERLIEKVNPTLISDHASFSWSQHKGKDVHAGDLLPLEFSASSLDVLVENIDKVQQTLGRQLLLENVSSYIDFDHSELSETEFLVTTAERSQCKLLVDLNNLLVNARNSGSVTPLEDATQWLNEIPSHLVGEIHLAGYTSSSAKDIIIDDHSQAVSDDCWELYRIAIERFGSVATLIEWDNELPSWNTLVGEADKARRIFSSVYSTAGEQAHVA